MSFAEMMSTMSDSNTREKKPIKGKQREKYADMMQPIPDLKPGDVLKWKEGLRNAKSPSCDQNIEVFRLIDKNERQYGLPGSQHEASQNDFTALFKDPEGDIMEYCFDSRRFERVK